MNDAIAKVGERGGMVSDISKAFTEHFWKPFEEQPGWVYLSVAVYFGVAKLSLGGTWRLSTEVWVAALTAILYLGGHLVDRLVFNLPNGNERYELDGLGDARKNARDEFEIQDGVYHVSMKLLAKGGKARVRAAVYFQNEFAKFLRSLAIPALALGLYFGRLAIRGSYFSAMHNARLCLIFIIVGLLLPILAVNLKLRHMKSLYLAAKPLRQEKNKRDNKNECGTHDLDLGASGKVRLFFWQGHFLASAFHEPERDKRTESAVRIEKKKNDAVKQ